MQNDFIDLMEPTPTLKTKKCRLIARILKYFLQYTTLLSALIAWYMYDYFIAGATLIIAFVIVGIIRAKMRNSVIPVSQREYHYNDEGIANWFCSKVLCAHIEEPLEH